jgi:phosphatidylethanolamine/phosphatidyl-N-methylethanolamine N-methyltransferase
MKKHDFVKAFFKDAKMVGSMRPSSKSLTKKMLAGIDFEKAKTIVELGPGTGVITRKIIEKMAPDAQLFVFELHDEFYLNLNQSIDDKRVHIIHDSAEKIKEYLEKYNVHCTDAVVSSLPLANFPKSLRANVVEAAKDSLTDDGLMTQFQYSLQSKNYLKSKFKDVKINYTLWNFPPAFVYSCRKSTNGTK